MPRVAPAFQFYVDDFLGGTAHMSCEEVGLYVRLLCLQWSHGVVTDRHIRAFSGTASPDSVSFVLSEKFEPVDGGYQNPRMRRVRETTQERQKAGSRGGTVSQANRQANRQANGEQNVNSPTPTPTPTPDPSPESISKAAASFAAAARNDFDFQEVIRLKAGLQKASPALEEVFAWKVACVGHAIERGIVSDWIQRLQEGDVKRAKRWLEAAIDGECRRKGFTWDAIEKLVKVPERREAKSANGV